MTTPEADHSCNHSKALVVQKGRTPRIKSSRSASKEIFISCLLSWHRSLLGLKKWYSGTANSSLRIQVQHVDGTTAPAGSLAASPAPSSSAPGANVSEPGLGFGGSWVWKLLRGSFFFFNLRRRGSRRDHHHHQSLPPVAIEKKKKKKKRRKKTQSWNMSSFNSNRLYTTSIQER